MIGRKETREAKRVRTEELHAYIEETKGLERDYIEELKDGKRRGWLMGYMGLALGCLGIAAGWAGLHQDPPPPVIFKTTEPTGNVEVLTVLKEQETSYGEVVDRYFLNKYVLSRESYDYDTLQTLYDTTGLLSAPNVQTEYRALFDGPNARDKVLSNRTRIIVNVKSIAINPLTPGSKIATATVRFSTQAKHTNQIDPPKHLIATIGYLYLTSPMSEHDRRINPLGLQVTSYRVDPEIVSASGD